MTTARPNVFHPWHDLEIGGKYPDIVHALIEIPARSKVKYTVAPNGMLFVERVLSSATVYPHDYGFIPKTLCDDGRALDVLVMTQEKVAPMSFMRIKPIGAIRIVDRGVPDDKIIAVGMDDPCFRHINDFREVPPHRFKEIKAFFEDYKKNQDDDDDGIATLPPNPAEGCMSPRVKLNMRNPFEPVWVSEEILGPDDAKRILQDAHNMYNEVYASAAVSAASL